MNFKKLTLMSLLAAGHIFATDGAGLGRPPAGLGYDPRVTTILERDGTVTASPSRRKTVYVHGFGANKDAAHQVKRIFGTGRLPGDVVTFDFPDAAYERMDTSKSSLGNGMI